MLIEFKVTNFRSIKDSQSFSMEVIKKFKELPKNKVSIDNLDLLKTSVIYGKNASGKSNLLLAFGALEFLVRNSGSFKFNEKINCYEPFQLEKKSSTSPTIFEILFLGKNKIKYHYKVIFNNEKIIEEKLFYHPKNQPAKLFERNDKAIVKPGDIIKGKIEYIQKNLFPNQLFLSKIGTEKVDELMTPYLFFDNFLFTSIPNQSCNLCDKNVISAFAKKLFKDKDIVFWENVNKLLKVADTGINSIEIKEINENDFIFPDSISDDKKKKIIDENRLRILTKHNIFTKDKISGETSMDLDEESAGTNRLLAVGGLALDALSDGTTLIIDELDRSLHPFLTRIIIEMFNDPRTNPNNAQLIFSTHDISILTNKLFRRDQFWFTEKGIKGNTELYSLGDINGVRKDVSYEKFYMNGLFGGIPNVNFYDFNFNLKKNE